MADEKNPDVTITMRVDCPGLTSDEKGIENVANYINLSDTLGDTEDEKGKVTTFDTIVHSDAIIEWEGKSSDGIDSVHITNVFENKGEKNCFSELPSEKGDGSENWKAVALNVDDLEEGLACEYSISFTINGDRTVYTLDPKLQIRKKESTST